MQQPKKGTVKKISVVKPTADSTAYYKQQQKEAYQSAAKNISSPKYSDQAFKRAAKIGKDIDRQSLKGKPGYDKNGFPIKKAKKGGPVKTKTKTK